MHYAIQIAKHIIESTKLKKYKKNEKTHIGSIGCWNGE